MYITLKCMSPRCLEMYKAINMTIYHQKYDYIFLPHYHLTCWYYYTYPTIIFGVGNFFTNKIFHYFITTICSCHMQWSHLIEKKKT